VQTIIGRSIAGTLETKREGDHGGIERRIGERQLLGGRLQDLRVDAELRASPAQSTGHVRVGFDEHESGYRRRVMRQVQARAGPDFDGGAARLPLPVKLR